MLEVYILLREKKIACDGVAVSTKGDHMISKINLDRWIRLYTSKA